MPAKGCGARGLCGVRDLAGMERGGGGGGMSIRICVVGLSVWLRMLVESGHVCFRKVELTLGRNQMTMSRV